MQTENKDKKSISSVSIIVPVFNEETTLLDILEKIRSVKFLGSFDYEIIVVDDCSTDSTFSLLEEHKKENKINELKIVRHEKNQGKGGALHTGLKMAQNQVIIIQDADLEYDPEDYGVLLTPIIENKADVVYGSRFMGGNAHRVLFFWHSVGNRFLTLLSNIFTDLNLSDMETCYKAFKREVIQPVRLKEKRFGFEPEVTAKISRIKGVRIYEVGISYYGRTYAEGKKIGWKDGFRAIYCILKYNLWSRGA